MIPEERRRHLAAYFTPPHLVNHVIDLLVTAGITPGTHKILDPASGGAAFLVPLSMRIREDIRNYHIEADRIALGIDLLSLSGNSYRVAPRSREALPYRAWLLLNETFYHAGRARGINKWRLFQLAFVLAHIPTIASRMPEFAMTPWFDPRFDEETATLLYFPTGGGKSEAFFGLLVFNMFLDRLRGKGAGVTALIRYPLRLLTLQQAQRLLVLLVRAELIRRNREIAANSFEIGFWVGNNNTPNSPDDKRLDPVPRAGRSKVPER